jgi:hypothetical protein
MTDTRERARNDNPMKIFGMIIPSLPSILFRCSGEYLRFRSKARKGGYLFQNKLIDQGVDRNTAERLTEIYLDGSNFFKYLFAIRPSNRLNK